MTVLHLVSHYSLSHSECALPAFSAHNLVLLTSAEQAASHDAAQLEPERKATYGIPKDSYPCRFFSSLPIIFAYNGVELKTGDKLGVHQTEGYMDG